MPGCVAEKDELIGRLSFQVKQPEKRLGPIQGLVATDHSKEALVQQELGNLHVLVSLCEVLFVGNEKAKLMIWLSFERQDGDVLDKFRIPAEETIALRELASLDRVGDAVEYPVVGRQRFFSFVGPVRGKDQRIDLRDYPKLLV